MKYLATASLILLLFINFSVHAQDSEWNQWRGPKRDGTIDIELPENLEDINKSWEVTLGPSYSGPVTQNGFVFTSTTYMF